MSSIPLASTATEPSDLPLPANGHIPEMLQLDPAHEIRDTPVCAIVDRPAAIEDAPDQIGDVPAVRAQRDRVARLG